MSDPHSQGLVGSRVTLRPFASYETERLTTEIELLDARVPPSEGPDRTRIEARVRNSGTWVDGTCEFAIEADGRLIGWIQTYRPPDRTLPEGVHEMGIVLFRGDDRGHGLGTEAVSLFIGWLRRSGAVRVQAVTADDNRAMRRVLLKLGFAPVETLMVDGIEENLFALDLSDHASFQRTFGSDSGNDFVCSFCQRKRSDGDRRMIAGPDGIFICDDCIELCVEILEEERRV